MSFEQLVLLKLDEIQRSVNAHGERLATLEERSKSAPRGKVINLSSSAAAGAVGALLSFAAAHWGSK